MFKPSAYQAHEALVGPARGKAQLWRLAVGIVLIAGVFLLSYQFVEQTLFTLLGATKFAALTGADGRGSQVSVLFLLSSFGLIIFSVVVALRVAHNRGFLDVLGEWRLLCRQFVAVLTMIVILYAALAILPPWDMGAPLKPNLSFGAWVLILPFALIAILVQVSAEEILFRGYLQQQLAARFSSPLIWVLVPAAVFGMGHYMPQAGDIAIVILIWSTLFGVAMADLTARAGTLGPAIALHLINNAVAILFVSMPDSISGLSLYNSPFDLSDEAMVRAWMPVEFMMILVCWLAARLAIRR